MKRIYIILMAALLWVSLPTIAAPKAQDSNPNLTVIKGKVIDASTSKALVFATVGLRNSNLATVSNSEGRFVLKIPHEMTDSSLLVTYIGHKSYEVPIASLKTNKSVTIRLEPIVVTLDALNVFPDDPHIIINKVLENIYNNYSSESELMTGFYRETIKKRRVYTALAEAVVEVNKPSYTSSRIEQVRMLKGRKGVNPSKMDTLMFKLQGGAHSMLSIDIIKYPHSILSPEVQSDYDYKFETITRIDDELHLVISFKQRAEIYEPMFYGKLYIHAETMAISSASFSLNTENRHSASSIFIRKKPFGCDVYPIYANYMVNYRKQGDKWYYSYSRGEVNFKVNWKKRLFNTNYITSSELAITDRKSMKVKSFKGDDKLKSNTIISETVAGFYDKDFWGEYNVIEPEKSINTAIKKIAKNMDELD